MNNLSPLKERTNINVANTSTIECKIKNMIEYNKWKMQWRPLLAFWILGICNNYGYVVMLSAANDMLEGQKVKSGNSRECNILSTGAILLADIIPVLLVKILSPFLPFYINVRMLLAVALSAGGYLLVALSQHQWISILGVVFTSLSSGLGETSLLQYSSHFDRNVLSTWSSGTGAAGIFASTTYAALASLGLRTTILIMLVVPILQAVTFWLLLPNLKNLPVPQQPEHSENLESIEMTFKDKMRLIVPLLKYMIPLLLVYFFEYFINQGAYELVRFEDTFLTVKDQYKWLFVDYQLGVFLSRSSVNLFYIKHIWIMAVLQGLNVVIFTTEVIYYWIPHFWIMLVLSLWEGLLGGAAYVNTYYRVSLETPLHTRSVSMGITGFSDAIGISISGILSIFVHNVICKLPKPARS